MQGFLDMKMKNWVRNLITRVVAIAPSLIVSAVVFALMAAYLVAVIYLTFRKYGAVSERVQGQMETGTALASAADGDQPAPYRKDLSDASM